MSENDGKHPQVACFVQNKTEQNHFSDEKTAKSSKYSHLRKPNYQMLAFFPDKLLLSIILLFYYSN